MAKRQRFFWLLEIETYNGYGPAMYEFLAGTERKAKTETRRVIRESYNHGIKGVLFVSYADDEDPIPRLKVSREYHGSKVLFDEIDEDELPEILGQRIAVGFPAVSVS